ncbi:BppU family phage baseplate upper protein [Leuconostoc mesenteroides]|uniref:BppU family phage baseplate upper protein n=1 Tax=Leuconostoc mesenteroides TaxID=1245 RepID=UPI000B9D77EC|nr:BppU family phage baseplate upper protein [Leuconostoc mesenteroides]BAX73100.1 phage infection protein [Leuconostoc mesenteroides]
MSNQYLSFDVSKVSPKQQLITARQGDGQLKFVTVSLWDSGNGKPYGLINRQLVFEALKPDGTHFIDTNSFIIIDRNKGIFRYTFNEQLFSASGKFQQAFFKITSTDDQGNVITEATLDVGISVLPNLVEFNINSADYLSEYDDLIKEVEKKFEDYQNAVAADENKLIDLHNQIVNLSSLIQENSVVTTTKNYKTFNHNTLLLLTKSDQYKISRLSEVVSNVTDDFWNKTTDIKITKVGE